MPMPIKLTNNIGLLVLAIYLILVGISEIIPALSLPTIIYGLLAIIAGVLILIGR